jgi:hypothetical protein
MQKLSKEASLDYRGDSIDIRSKRSVFADFRGFAAHRYQ